jgi:hypothetical protein
MDNRDIRIPLADWPLVKAAIAELNAAKKEKDMKEDRYEFDLSEWEFEYDADCKMKASQLTVTRKKSKVKAEWWGFRNEGGDVEELLDTPYSAVEYFLANEWEHGFFSDEPCEMTLVALSDEDVETDFGTMKKIIGEARVRLGLTVSKVESD